MTKKIYLKMKWGGPRAAGVGDSATGANTGP